MFHSTARSTSLTASFLYATFNFALAVQLFGIWRSLAWEPESEWEGSGFSLSRDGARLICGLFSAYFAAASAICVFGLAGIVKVCLFFFSPLTPLTPRVPTLFAIQSIPSFVRIYRNYLIGDFTFFTLFAGFASSAAFDPASRSNICEQISTHPDLLRDVIDMGLTLENCEQWFERGVVAFMAVLLLFTVVRVRIRRSPNNNISLTIFVSKLHFIFALSRYYAHLVRNQDPAQRAPVRGMQMERIYLLPDRHSTVAGNKDSHPIEQQPH
ncbi:hypothetical protein BU15DRAFT_55643 [Melanogaster broomeanus]|nr:hypothetical protein BU15DRAFT_55643 [Melanogaster broomeanus]